MRKGRIKVQDEPGVFPSERTVTFHVGERKYTLVVDESLIKDGLLDVYVVAEDNAENQVLIDLPQDTFTSGNRIVVPSSLLVAA